MFIENKIVIIDKNKLFGALIDKKLTFDVLIT